MFNSNIHSFRVRFSKLKLFCFFAVTSGTKTAIKFVETTITDTCIIHLSTETREQQWTLKLNANHCQNTKFWELGSAMFAFCFFITAGKDKPSRQAGDKRSFFSWMSPTSTGSKLSFWWQCGESRAWIESMETSHVLLIQLKPLWPLTYTVNNRKKRDGSFFQDFICYHQ